MSLQASFQPVTTTDKTGRVAYPDLSAVHKRTLLEGSVKSIDGGMLVTSCGYRDPRTTANPPVIGGVR